MMLRLPLLIIFFFAVIGSAYSQTAIKVSGQVKDETGKTLEGATIAAKQSSKAVSSSADGSFEIMALPTDQLTVSYVGYKTEVIDVKRQSSVMVIMKPLVGSGQEVVVVGYSKQKKVNLTGSVAVISGEELTKRPVLSISSALQGALPGVTVSQFSGTPGTESQVRIRGLGTLGNNDPLVLIDGVVAGFGDIDPDNVQSISVLKDAASASIYGSRAAAGVILITSKRGQSGKMRVTYDGTAGYQKPVDQPKFLRAVDYMKLYNEAITNEGGTPIYSDAYINSYAENHAKDPDHYPDVDWWKATIHNALQQQHNISLSGGSDKIRFMGAINYMDQDGLVANSNFKRYSLRMNTDYRPTEKLSFAFDLNLRQQDDIDPQRGYGAIFGSMNRVPSVYAARYSDGSWGPGWNTANSVAYSEDGGLSHSTFRSALINLSANYSPIKNLDLNLTFAPRFTNNFSKVNTTTINYYDFDSKALIGRSGVLNSLTNSFSNTLSQYLKFQANYTRHFKAVDFSLLAGAEQTDSRYDGFSAKRVATLFPDLQQLDAYPSDNQDINGSGSEWALRSLFGRMNLVVLDKYLLEVNSRYDGSSRFAADYKRYGYFPSVSAGWVLSKESFMQNLNFINLLKLRASWGVLGNQEIGNYPYISSINLGQGVINGNITNTASQDVASNRKITWESTTVSDIGFDAGLLNSKINLEFDYYVKKTDNILLTLPIPITTGLNPAVQNAGKVQNKGWEGSVGYNNRIGKNFKFHITGILSDVRNKVVDLAGTGPYISGFQITQEGQEMDAIYGLQSAGLFQSVDEISRSPKQFGALNPGDIKYVDQNGDGVINSSDRVIIGSRIPRYTYSLNLFTGYKNFDLTVFLQGVGKWNGYLYQDAAWAFFNAGNVRDIHLNRWSDSKTAEENAKATYPRFFITHTNNQQTSSYWLTDASFLKLKTLSLGYNFSKKVLGNGPIDNARIYISGQNVFSWDKMKGFDPETPLGNAVNYPQVSLLVIGVRIGLK